MRRHDTTNQKTKSNKRQKDKDKEEDKDKEIILRARHEYIEDINEEYEEVRLMRRHNMTKQKTKTKKKEKTKE